jgi:2,4-dienoyl-CoA reductase-like NADH-dependent reductase (Old Yellow Enzyme family)
MDNSIIPSIPRAETTNINNATYDTSSIFSSIKLPISNRIVPNRLVKVALYEHGASFGGGPPTSAFHIPLYARWARGGWGIIMTGNVQVSADHLTLGKDLIVPSEDDGEARAAYRKLADTIHKEGTPGALALMQLSHAGRQSPNILGGRGVWGEPPVAPSSVPLAGQGPIGSLLFRTPRAMDEGDIDRVVASFVNGAKLALDAGFDGVELHASHGCACTPSLLSYHIKNKPRPNRSVVPIYVHKGMFFFMSNNPSI